MSENHNPWAERNLKAEQAEEQSADEAINKAESSLDEEIKEIEEAENQVEQGNPVQEKLSEAHEQLLRAHAEMENLRRRTEQDVVRAHKFALEKFVDALIPVVDSLEQSLMNAKADDPMVEGVKLTLKMFQDVLVKFGVRILDPVNEKFNPQLHEAMSMQPNSGAEPNTVLVVYQKGYVLNDRLIRPARVVVSA